ncbi:unnamed protein product [Dibothriocephalus latus]|uniref:Prokaryotic-type class I peptide chain release factors domain-containing protein n=1 Tax=Dibothriocephalus latus TaxID=60516 RepID=A0A3P7LXP3_DIBLA|nr:unnamed protein product [Dibothriocephalus latus]
MWQRGDLPPTQTEMLSFSKSICKPLLTAPNIRPFTFAGFHLTRGLGADRFTLQETDLEEQFVCGWGPGGQKINKTANCVLLKHIPTGVIVKCQESRQLHQNRKLARERLRLRVDELLNGEESQLAKARRVQRLKENKKFSRAKRRLEMKAAFKAALEEPSDPTSNSTTPST